MTKIVVCVVTTLIKMPDLAVGEVVTRTVCIYKYISMISQFVRGSSGAVMIIKCALVESHPHDCLVVLLCLDASSRSRENDGFWKYVYHDLMHSTR